MMGKRGSQRTLLSAAAQLGDKVVARMGFHGRLAEEGHRLFQDEDFAKAYCRNNGRPSAPPALLALARLLQHHDGISDAEVIERCRYDLRWKVALDLDLASVKAPFAKSTFQAFRVRLSIHQQEGLAFEKSVRSAKEAGLLPQRLRIALDSSPVRGRGALKDTFNLLSDAIAVVVRAVADEQERPAGETAREAGLERHIESPSIKGSEMVDWDDPNAVSRFLRGLLEDSERAVALAGKAKCAGEEAAFLRQVIAQDVETDSSGGGPRIRDGVAPGRVVSAHDPEMRHGHKSSGKVYNGHKAHVAVDTSHGVITGVDSSAPGEPDGAQVASLVKQTEQVTGCPVDQGLGDAAYSTRKAIGEADKCKLELVSKMPSPPRGRFGPAAFEVSEDGRTAKCPAGIASAGRVYQKDSILHRWSLTDCGSCPLRAGCTKAARRSLVVSPDFHDRRRRERFARSPEGRRLLRQRVAAEHAIGRLKNLGAGAARYFGRAKTRAQWLWTAAVVNLQLAWAAPVPAASVA